MTDRIIKVAEERGEFEADMDGFIYYWPKGSGSLSAHDLRILADELDRRNAAWKKDMDDYFEETKDVGGC